MSRRRARSAALKMRRPVTAWGLAFWLALGLVSSVPAFFIGRAIGGSPEAPGGSRASSAGTSGAPREDVEYHCQRGYEYLSAEGYSEAFDEFYKASRINPSDPRPHMGLGEVCRGLDYDERAERHYRRAIELDPGSVPAKVSLSMILCDFGRNREAIDLLKEVEKVQPDDPFLWAEFAINAMRLGNPREAIPLLEKYNEKEGRQAWGYENLGRAYVESGEPEKAEKALRGAIEINPRTALAHLWLGQLLITLGRRAEADEVLKTFLELRDLQTEVKMLVGQLNRKPDDVMTLVRLAHVRTLLGQYEQALGPLERAMKLAPSDDRLPKLYEQVKRQMAGGGK